MCRIGRQSHAVFAMELRRELVSRRMMRKAEAPTPPRRGHWGSRRPAQGRRPVQQPLEHCRGPRFQKKEIQTGEKLQLARTVLERFRKYKATLDCGTNLFAVSLGEHRRYRQRLLKDQLLPGAAAGVVEGGQRPFTPTPAFLEQGQSDENGAAQRGEFDPDGNVAVVGERPSSAARTLPMWGRVARKIMFADP